MTDHRSDAELKNRLWKEIKEVRYGMLGPIGVSPPQHFQPMTAFVEEETGDIWFFSRADSDLARAAGPGGCEVMFTVQAKDQKFQACVGGVLHVHRDAARIDKYWNPFIAAWYPEGKDDPNLTLLHLKAGEARVWVDNEGGMLRFAFEIAKANLTKTQPDAGEVRDLKLGGGVTAQ